MNNLRKISLFVLMAAAIIVIIGFSACEESGVIVPVKGVSLDNNTLVLDADNESHKLTAKVFPENANDKSLKWESTDPDVVHVDANGIITGVNPGTATIIVSTVDGNFTDRCTVTIGPFKTINYSLLKWWLNSENTSSTLTNYIKVVDIPSEAIAGTSSPSEAGTLGKIIKDSGKRVSLIPVLPDEEIGEYAFYGVENLEEVKLPDTLSRIERFAFYNCINLASVDLSNCTNLTEIGQGAFGYCTSLTSIDLSNCTNLTEIGNGFFRNCTSLISVDLSDCTNLNELGGEAFKECTSLASVDLSNCTNLNVIGYRAFALCQSLASVDLSDCTNLNVIGQYAFYNCTSLASVDLSYCTNLTEIGQWAFGYCTSLASVDLSNCTNLAAIGQCAFSFCQSLASLDLSNCTNLNVIGNQAFALCQSLASVDLFNCTNLTEIGRIAFSNCTSANIILPASIISIGTNAFGSDNSTYCQNVTVPTQAVKDLVTVSGYPESRIIGPPAP